MRKPKIYDIVKDALTEYPFLRDNDLKLIWHLLQKQGLAQGEIIHRRDFIKSYSFETITRCRRKVQSDFPELSATAKAAENRKKLQERVKKNIYNLFS